LALALALALARASAASITARFSPARLGVKVPSGVHAITNWLNLLLALAVNTTRWCRHADGQLSNNQILPKDAHVLRR